MAKLEEYVAKLMKSISVIKLAIEIKRAELTSLHQDHDKLLEHLQPMFVAKQKLVILQQSVSVNVEKKSYELYERINKRYMLAGVCLQK